MFQGNTGNPEAARDHDFRFSGLLPATLEDVQQFERLAKASFPDDYREFLLVWDFQQHVPAEVAIESSRSIGWFDRFEPLHAKKQPYWYPQTQDEKGTTDFRFAFGVVVAFDRSGCPWVLSLFGPDRGYVYHCPSGVAWRDPGLIVASSFTEFGELVMPDEVTPVANTGFETVYEEPMFKLEEADPAYRGAAASVEAIEKFEERCGHRLPDDYREFLTTEPPRGDLYNEDAPQASTKWSTVEFDQFLSIGAPNQFERIQFDALGSFPDSVVIAVDGGGQDLVMSLAGPDRGYVYHCWEGVGERDPDFIVAPTFTDFLKALGFAN